MDADSVWEECNRRTDHVNKQMQTESMRWLLRDKKYSFLLFVDWRTTNGIAKIEYVRLIHRNITEFLLFILFDISSGNLKSGVQTTP